MVLSLIEYPKKENQEVTTMEKHPLTGDPKWLLRGHVSVVCLLVRRKTFVLLVCGTGTPQDKDEVNRREFVSVMGEYVFLK